MSKSTKAVKKAKNDEKLAQMREQANEAAAASEAEIVEEQESEDNLPSVEESPEDSAPEEEQQEVESEEQPDEEVQEEEQPAKDEDVSRLSAKAQKRYRNLANQNTELRAQNERLQSVVAALQNQGYSNQEINSIAPDVAEQVSGLTDQTEEQYRKEIITTASKLVDQRLAEKERETARREQIRSFNSDLVWLEDKYPELNPKDKKYDSDLDSYLSSEYETLAKSDPTVRLRDVAENVMDIREKAVKSAKKDFAQEIVNDVSEEAIAPSTSGPEMDADIDSAMKNAKSVEELEEVMNKHKLR